jgi:hypothetical protein
MNKEEKLLINISENFFKQELLKKHMQYQTMKQYMISYLTLKKKNGFLGLI